MEWHFQCPCCGGRVNSEWDSRHLRHKCIVLGDDYFPPGPGEQSEAFVDSREWPAEMEERVVALKGNNCTALGCDKKYETLDHRLDFSKGGKTSVENLWPMCAKHNKSKGDTDYAKWLETLYSPTRA